MAGFLALLRKNCLWPGRKLGQRRCFLLFRGYQGLGHHWFIGYHYFIGAIVKLRLRKETLQMHIKHHQLFVIYLLYYLLMRLSVCPGRHRKLVLKSSCKLALAFIANRRCNFRYTRVRFSQHFSGLFHSVFFDMGRKRGSIDRFEHHFQSSWIDIVILCSIC